MDAVVSHSDWVIRVYIQLDTNWVISEIPSQAYVGLLKYLSHSVFFDVKMIK